MADRNPGLLPLDAISNHIISAGRITDDLNAVVFLQLLDDVLTPAGRVGSDVNPPPPLISETWPSAN
jgi:hypothetical protein